MRPVNLIPLEERRGERAPSRTGALPYLLVGALVLAVAAVTGIVLTSNQISDREAELASLEAQEAEASARAAALRPYADFATMAEARDTTVTSLAQSRFDWERVLNELALVIPDDVWLIKVTGTATPDVEVEESAEIPIRSEVPGPALTMIGCGASQESVAAFAAALRDVDGVTRVTVSSAERPDLTSSAGGSGSEGVDDCRTRDFISRFEVVAAFDEVPVPAGAVAPGTPGAPAAPEAPPEIADAAAGRRQAEDEVSGQIDQARETTNLVPGVAR
ncbi:MAG: PilN domain-containing protein [Solirubrobacterales bacterium]